MAPTLLVDRSELVRALGIIAKQAKRKYVGDAMFSFANGQLRIDLDGLTVKAAAEGEWPGRARVAAAFAVAAAALAFPNDRVSLGVVGNQLVVDGLSRPC